MNVFSCYNIGDIVTFATFGGDLESQVIFLRGKVVESDEKHISVRTENNYHSPASDDITHYIDVDILLSVHHCGMDDNPKVREYILSHWNEYDLTDTKEDFVKLLNILESHDSCIDELHSSVLNGYGCCGYLPFDTDRELVKALLDDHAFYDDYNELYKVILENAEIDDVDEFEEAQYIDVRVTHDGFVLNHQC